MPTRNADGDNNMWSWLQRNREVNIYLALAVTLTVIIGVMLFALRSATELHDTLYPLADATMELAMEASLAHLYLEQSLITNDSGELNKAWLHLDRLDRYARAMVEGGTVNELRFKPVGNAALRHKVTYVRIVIMEYRTTALKRIGIDPATPQGKAYRAVHDAVFKELIERTAEAEAQFRLQMTRDLAGFRHLQVLLIVVSLGFSVLAAITFHKYMVERKRREQRIKHLNLVLRAIRNVSHLITVEKNQHRLIKKTCDLLVETRGFHNAWIALTDEKGKPSIYAEAGLKNEFNLARELLDQGELLPCCDRLRSMEGVLVIKDPPAECASCPLAIMYTGRGGLATRLEHDRQFYGYMVVSSPRAFVTDKEEQGLFEEVAKDIALSLHLIATQEERLRVEQALRESEARYRLLADNATDVIWAVDKNMCVTYVSPSVTRLRGFSVGEAVGQRLEEMVTRNSLEAARQAITQGLWPHSQGRDCTAGSQIVELELVCKDGTTVWTETSLSPLRDSEGNVTELLGVTRDITERKYAEKTIKDSETRYRTLFESAGDAIFLMDKDRFIDCNTRAEQMFGRTRESLIGASPLQFCPEQRPDGGDDREILKERINRAWRGQPQFFEWRLVNDDGTVFDVEINLNKIDTGKTQCLLAIVRDVTDRKKAAGALAESEKKYRTLAEGLEQLIYRMPLADPHQVYVNQAAEKIYGYAPQEWTQKPELWQECIHPADVDMVTEAFNKCVAQGGQSIGEYRIIARDGTVRWVEDRVKCEKDEHGVVVAVSGVVTDITERKQASEKLKRTTELLQSIMDSSTEECIIATDPTGIILSWNEGARRLLGYKAEEVVGVESVHLFCTEEYVKSGIMKKNIETMKATGLPVAEAMTYVAKDGRRFPVHQIVAPRFGEDGQCIGFLGLARDVSDAKKAEETLKSSERRFHDIALSSADWIWETDVNNKYVFTSGRVEQLLGYKPKELIGKTPFDVMAREEARRVSAIWNKAVKSKDPITGLEYLSSAKDGSEVCLMSNGVPILDANGNLTGYRGVSRDITAEKQIAKEIAKYTAELERANLELKENKGELEEFIYTVSHDLKAPVVSISGFAGLIKQRSLKEIDQTTTKYLERIAVNAEIMEHLINDLLELSRIGRADEDRVAVNMNSLMEDVFGSFSVAASRKQTTLSVVGSLPCVRGWHDRIRQLLTNLIDNAIKYMPDGAEGLVRVGFNRDIQGPNGQTGAFFVSDNGEGIPKEFQPRLFKAFQRVQRECNRAEGSGVGLSIVKRITEAHGGHAWFDCGTGKGSTFYFSLPLEDDTRSSSGTDRAKEAPREVM